MRLKYLGAIFIITACLCAGAAQSRSRKQRLESLTGLCAALDMLAAELKAAAPPMPLLCAGLARRCVGCTGDFFRQVAAATDRLGEEAFATLWRQAAEDSLRCLRAEEREELAGLGAMLGRYELDETIASVRLCLGRMCSFRDEARAAYPADRKLGLGLAAAAGALLIVALI